MAQAVRLEDNTADKLKGLYIETNGVKLKSMEDKISFLMWFYSSHINNNGNTK